MLYRRLFARLYDVMLRGSEEAGLRSERRRTLAGAHGRVVEVGAGTGLNLDLYPEGIEELILAEPEEPMARRLGARLAERGEGPPARIVTAPAEDLPLPDSSADTVVSTLVLCTVDDPQGALAEIRRVLRPGGLLLFLEHVRSDQPRLARWQDRIEPLWRRVGAGCRCNRETGPTIRTAGFEVERLEEGRVPKAPPWVRPLIAGSARRPA